MYLYTLDKSLPVRNAALASGIAVSVLTDALGRLLCHSCLHSKLHLAIPQASLPLYLPAKLDNKSG